MIEERSRPCKRILGRPAPGQGGPQILRVAVARGVSRKGTRLRRKGVFARLRFEMKKRLRTWKLRRERWTFPEGGGIMGILNVTPDSFSDGGAHMSPGDAVRHAGAMLEEGADIIDVGGESTRPGAAPVSIEEETARVVPVIEALRAQYGSVRVSVDTRHAAVAREALEAGADIVNDVAALRGEGMAEVCAEYGCGVVAMHMRGEPGTMQQNPRYDDVTAEVRAFFEERLAAFVKAGIDPACVCWDPGIGFGKTVAHNLALIAHLESLRVADLPMMIALSRKRFLGAILDDPAAGRETGATVAMSLYARSCGADVHRVHEVRPLQRALALWNAVDDAL